MNREQGDAPLAAGVDRGRMFWTVSGDSPPHGFPFSSLSTGHPSCLSPTLGIHLAHWHLGPSSSLSQALGLPPGARRLALGLLFTYSPLRFHLSRGDIPWSRPRSHQAPPSPPSMGSWDNKVPAPAVILYHVTLMVADSLQALWEP